MTTRLHYAMCTESQKSENQVRHMRDDDKTLEVDVAKKARACRNPIYLAANNREQNQ